MAVQWFPGHMHATRRAMTERLKAIDVVVEMLDARLPGSSANPMLAELSAGRPTLKILNKEDLADATRTEAWLAHYNAQPATRAVALHASRPAPARAIVNACRALAPQRVGMDRPLRILIGGIPNVGKSTLINAMVGRKAAQTGDEAGITRQEQRIVLADDVYLYDTPGVLWPRILVPEAGYHLAASGAVGRNAYDEQEVALELLRSIRKPYASLLRARYRLPADEATIAASREEDLLDAIARQRGALGAGGQPRAQKAAEILLQDFRSAALGRITLEVPEQWARWLKAALAAEAKRQAEKAALRETRARSKVSPS